jgi:putative flippase GtrA
MHLLRFALVGGTVALVYMAAYLGLMALGVPQIIANVLAFLGAVALQYLGQAVFTFRAPLRDRAQAIRFIAMILCGLVTAALITGPAAAALDLPDWLAALTVTLVLPVQNYAFMILWVFTKSDEKQQVLS